jgi:hypothetical protein
MLDLKPKETIPGYRLLPALLAFTGDCRKGIPVPLTTCGFPAAPLARGIGELAQDKIGQTKQNIRENTFGGRLATVIANAGADTPMIAAIAFCGCPAFFNAPIWYLCIPVSCL